MISARDRTPGRVPSVRGLALVLACAATTLLLSTVVRASGPPCELPLVRRQRYGFVALPDNWQQRYEIDQLNAGWYIVSSESDHSVLPQGMDPAVLIHIEAGYRVDAATLGPQVDHYPGATWLIGNEPDQIWQDNVVPEEYARIYHDLYAFIKNRDRAARVAAGGIVQPTPLRLEWLDGVLSAYKASYHQAMPVDVWHIHNAILNEVSCAYDSGHCWGAEIPPGIDAPYGEVRTISDNDNMDMFRDQIWAFRRWMADRGYGGVPLIVTEYGVLMPAMYGFDEERVNTFMSATFAFFESTSDPGLGDPNDNYRLVQRWAWFSLDEPPYDPLTNPDGFNGNLFDPDTTAITAFGQHYAAHTADFTPPSYVDLSPSAFRVQPLDALATPTQTITRALDVRIANVGTVDAVSFAVALDYSGPTGGALEQVVDHLPALSAQWLTFTLPDLPVGKYNISVEIDPADQVTEALECNNTATTVVLAPSHRVFLPEASHRAASPAVQGQSSATQQAGSLTPVSWTGHTAAEAAASSASWEEFGVPTANSYPAQIAIAQDGAVWITERDGNIVARFDPLTQSWQEYAIPMPGGQPWGIALDGDGNVWVAESSARTQISIQNAADGMARSLEFNDVSPAAVLTSSYNVFLPFIARHPWWAASDTIAMLDVAGGTFEFAHYDLPEGSEPWDLDVDNAGNVWFSAKGRDEIGKLVPGSGTPTWYSGLAPGAQPAGIDHYGSYVYFTEPGADRIGRLNTTTGQVADGSRGTGSQPQDVAVTPSGGPWFSETGANRIFLLDPSTLGMGCLVPVQTLDSEPYGIATDGNSLIWFTERAGNKLGLYQHPLDACSTHLEFPLPTPNRLPTGIAVDSEGCVWYTAPGVNRIGRLCVSLARTSGPLVMRGATQ
jgi:virginiamycin B lyase